MDLCRQSWLVVVLSVNSHCWIINETGIHYPLHSRFHFLLLCIMNILLDAFVSEWMCPLLLGNSLGVELQGCNKTLLLFLSFLSIHFPSQISSTIYSDHPLKCEWFAILHSPSLCSLKHQQKYTLVIKKKKVQVQVLDCHPLWDCGLTLLLHLQVKKDYSHWKFGLRHLLGLLPMGPHMKYEN